MDATFGQTGLLDSGDCKMAAMETRAEIATNQDFYLTRLPRTGTVPTQFAAWAEDAVVGDIRARRSGRRIVRRRNESWRPSSGAV